MLVKLELELELKLASVRQRLVQWLSPDQLSSPALRHFHYYHPHIRVYWLSLRHRLVPIRSAAASVWFSKRLIGHLNPAFSYIGSCHPYQFLHLGLHYIERRG